MDEKRSTWHMTQVYFGFRNEGPLPTDQDRKVIRLRRLVALGVPVVVALRVLLAVS
jgi:hypothetical protein